MVNTTGTTLELHYRDPEAALRWLEAVFGLETEMMVSDPEGKLAFARVQGPVGIVAEAPGRPSPASLGGASTQTVDVTLSDDLDAHYRRALQAGARIVIEPRQEFYGATNYVAADLEGHLWCFSQRVSEGGPPPDGWSVRFPAREKAAR
ncbi:MAG TPA: VOC family protein [Caulobacteraceae bacterium]